MEISDDSEDNTEPDGDGVGDSREVHVEQHEVHPGLGVLVRPAVAGLVHDVEVYGEGQVTQHSDDV